MPPAVEPRTSMAATWSFRGSVPAGPRADRLTRALMLSRVWTIRFRPMSSLLASDVLGMDAKARRVDSMVPRARTTTVFGPTARDFREPL